MPLETTSGACLFGAGGRTLLGPMPATGSHFDYLRSSARPEADRVRRFLDEAFARYPEAHRAGLRARITSPDAHQHDSGCFDLVLHEALTSAGAAVEVEPELPGTTKRSDFRVREDAFGCYLLEAVLASDTSEKQAAAGLRLGQMLEAVEALDSPVLLGVTVEALPDRTVGARETQHRLRPWLRGLPPSAEFPPDPELRPRLRLEAGGAVLTFDALPLARDPGSERVIAIQSGLMGIVVETSASIANAGRKKASRYGQIEAPYVIAVNAPDALRGEHYILDALFGSETVVLDVSGPEPRQVGRGRASDGLFHGPKGPQNTRVSGVLYFRRLSAWNLAAADAVFVPNPWAVRPLTAAPLGLPSYSFQDGEPVRVPGLTLRELLALPTGWPE